MSEIGQVTKRAADPRVSVVGPVHNERDNLETLCREIVQALDPLAASEGWTYEILLVDDASTDGSLDEARRLAAADPRIRVLRGRRQQGQSAALLAGIRAARGEVIVTTDSDLQNDPADMPALLAPLAEYDLVCGVRQKREDPLSKRLASRVANRVRSVALGDGLHDVGCGLRAMRAEWARDLPPFNGLHRFLGPLLVHRGARVLEVPVRHRPRRHGASNYGVHDRLWRGLWDLVGVRWLRSRTVELGQVEES